MMNFNPLELAMLQNALSRYCSYCESCLSNPDNETQSIFIEKDLEMALDVLKRVDQQLSAL